jgi:hypothetical protein
VSAPITTTGRDSHQPQPTVPRHRPTAARAFALTAGYALMAGFFASPVAWLLFRQLHWALVLATGAVSVSAAAGCVSAVLAARRLSYNPGAPAAAAPAAAGGAAWMVLPRIGLGWARYAAALTALWLAVAAVRWGLITHWRRGVQQRLAQVLEPELSTTKSHADQVAAGLAGVVPRAHERATSPSLGVAPRAAWSVSITRWDSHDPARPRRARLVVPWLRSIRDPDFLAKIKEALLTRFGAVAVELETHPLVDTIIIEFLDSEKKEQTEQDAQRQALDRVKILAGQLLPSVQVKILEWAGGGEKPPEDAPPAWGLRKFTISYGDTKVVTPAKNREAIRTHIGLQLFDDPGALRDEWKLSVNTVIMTRRAPFPALIPCVPLDLPDLYPGKTVLVYARDEDGNYVVFQLSHTDNPHMLLTGGTGTGKTVCLRVLMIRAARLGLDVRGCDPKRIEMRGLRGWPNITKIATRVQDMVQLINEVYNEMQERYTRIETGMAHASDFRRILLVIDEFLMFTMIVNDHWVEEKAKEGVSGSKEHPVMRKLRGLVVMGRSGLINIIIATQRGDATIFPDGVRDSLGDRVALGLQSKESAIMMFGDADVGRDIPPLSQGVGHARAALPLRIKCEFLPDPGDWNNETEPLSPEHRQLLLDMLPPGSTWEGPRTYQAPDPGFEDTTPTPDVMTGSADARLIFFVRTALRIRDAYLTDAHTGGAPATPATAAYYGWSARPDGTLEPCGKWVGSITRGGNGERRVYLHPASAIDVAGKTAAQLKVPFPFNRNQIGAALRRAGLIQPNEQEQDGEHKWTVRRRCPGNDLGTEDPRLRVWDLPADEVLGDLEEPDSPVRSMPAATEAEQGRWDDESSALPSEGVQAAAITAWGLEDEEPPDTFAPEEPPDPAPGGMDVSRGRWAWPSDLAQGARILLPPGQPLPQPEPVMADVEQVMAAPNSPGDIIIDCWLMDGTPYAATVSAGQRIWLIF